MAPVLAWRQKSQVARRQVSPKASTGSQAARRPGGTVVRGQEVRLAGGPEAAGAWGNGSHATGSQSAGRLAAGSFKSIKSLEFFSSRGMQELNLQNMCVDALSKVLKYRQSTKQQHITLPKHPT